LLGRNINRHNFDLDEVRTAFHQEVVQHLLRLMEFHNSYPTFDGEFEILDAPETKSSSPGVCPHTKPRPSLIC
jgi:hypothetical protein